MACKQSGNVKANGWLKFKRGSQYCEDDGLSILRDGRNDILEFLAACSDIEEMEGKEKWRDQDTTDGEDEVGKEVEDR